MILYPESEGLRDNVGSLRLISCHTTISPASVQYFATEAGSVTPHLLTFLRKTHIS